jgi:hypothetical protein
VELTLRQRNEVFGALERAGTNLADFDPDFSLARAESMADAATIGAQPAWA